MLKSSQALNERIGHTVPKVRNRLYAPMMAASILASSLFYSTFASALGLGEITLHSALNQPLNAEIQLLETDGLSPEDIVARLASPEAFAKAGVERVFFLNDLRFTPSVRGGRGVIRVVSNKPVTEPYLSFLVQVSRPNGDLLHEYTVLLDPATSPEGVAATRSRNSQRINSSAPSVPESRMPVAPPPAVQGKLYTVANGDTLNAIAGRLQGPGSKVSTSQMADGIRSLNPQVFAQGAGSSLKVGQNLLVPDSAVLPAASPAGGSAVAPQPQPAQAREATEQMAAAAVETQQLTKALEDLKAQTLDLQDQLIGKDKQITALRSDLVTAQSRPVSQPEPQAAAQPVAAPSPAVPVVQPVPAAAPAGPFISIPVLLALLLVFLLILAFVYNRRRQQRIRSAAPVATQDDPLIKPAQATVVPVFEVPEVAPQPVVVSGPAKASSSQRMAGAAPDALDGVSIYIAYGRFSEAIGILRNALEQQPEREDIRIRLLELLAEQGDSAGFAVEEKAALEHGVTPQALDEVRNRYPQLKAREALVAATAVAIPTAAAGTTPLEKNQPEAAASVVGPMPDLEQPVISELDETTAAALNPQPEDEFQLNLDDLSMDANWDLVDPFDTPAVRNKPAATPEIDPGFSSDLNQLPEVFELSDEQFLSDFADTDSIDPIEVIPPSGADDLSDDFLDSFMSDDTDFDLLELDEPPLSQINQAQVLINEGDIDSAREILLQVIAVSDEDHQRLARELLAGIS